MSLLTAALTLQNVHNIRSTFIHFNSQCKHYISKYNRVLFSQLLVVEKSMLFNCFSSSGKSLEGIVEN